MTASSATGPSFSFGLRAKLRRCRLIEAMRSIRPEMRRTLSRASATRSQVDQHRGAVGIGLGGGQRLVEFVRQGGRHLAESGELAGLDQIGLGLAQFLFGQPPLGDLLLDALVDEGEVGGALLDAMLQFVARFVCMRMRSSSRARRCRRMASARPGEAEEQHDGNDGGARLGADGARVHQHVHGPVGFRHILRQHQIFPAVRGRSIVISSWSFEACCA